MLRLGFVVLVTQLLQLTFFSVDFCLQLLLSTLVVLDQTVIESLVFFADLIDLLLLIILNLPNLTLQFINFFFLLFRMSSSLLSQMNQLRLTISLGLLQRLYLSLQIFDHLSM